MKRILFAILLLNASFASIINAQNTTVCEFTGLAIVQVDTAVTLSFQWQYFDGTWNDVVDDANYSGANTDTLFIFDIPYSFNGYLYQCIYTTTLEVDTGGAIQLTVDPGPSPAITANGATTFCDGDSVALDAGSYSSYLWNNSTTDETLTATTSGTFIVTVTDGNGCTGITSQDVTVNPNPTPSITTGPIGCDSSILIAGNYASYQWNISNGTTDSVTIYAPGIYSVTVTDTNGCTGSDSYFGQFFQSPSPQIAYSGPPAICVGGNLVLDAGSVDPITGNPYVAYNWNNSITYETDTIINGGIYSVTVTDNHGCTGTASTMMIVNDALNPMITDLGQSSICFPTPALLDAGTSDPITGNPYSTYIWNDFSNVEFDYANSSGVYSVTVSDINSCTGSASINVNVILDAVAPIITPSGNTALCSGDSVILDADIWNSYLWNTNATDETITADTAGNYSVTVTDNFGCTGVASIAVSMNPNPIPVITPSGDTTFCEGNFVTLTSTPEASYQWMANSFLIPTITQSLSTAASGSYQVSVTDTNGCTGISAPIMVANNPNPTPFSYAFGPTSFCSGYSVTLDGGSYSSSTPYNDYLWNNGVTTEFITVDSTYNYIVTVTDSNGCTGTSSQAITVYPLPTPIIFPNGPTTFCVGGAVILNVGSYDAYLWNNGFTTESIATLLSGTFTVTVTDYNGCEGDTSITVTVYPDPNPSITANGPTTFCNGSSVDLDAGVYAQYLWSNGETTETITVNNSGTYSVTVTSTYGCSNAASQTITVIPSPSVSIISNGITSFCNAGTDTLQADNSFTSYLWNTGASTQSIVVNNAGTYSITITDANGCTARASQTITVNTPPTPTIMAFGDTTFCQGDSVVLYAFGTYSHYLWSNGDSLVITVIKNAGGNYSLTVTDANGCTGSVSITVTIKPGAQPVITGGTSICNNTFLVLNAGANYSSYLWSNGSTNQMDSVFTSNTYSVTVDSAGCSGITSTAITVNTAPTPAITTYRPAAFCTGITDSLMADTGYVFYQWSNGQTTRTISVNADTLFAVTVTDDNGCTGTDTLRFYVGTSNSPFKIIAKANRIVTDILICPNCNFQQYIWGYDSKTSPIDSTVSCDWTLNYCKYDIIDTTKYYYWLYVPDNGTNCGDKIYYNAPPGLKSANDYLELNNEISIYPNPANNYEILSFTTNTEDIYSIRLLDITGRDVMHSVFTSVIGENQYQLNLSTIAKGVYTVILQNETTLFQSKIVIQ